MPVPDFDKESLTPRAASGTRPLLQSPRPDTLFGLPEQLHVFQTAVTQTINAGQEKTERLLDDIFALQEKMCLELQTLQNRHVVDTVVEAEAAQENRCVSVAPVALTIPKAVKSEEVADSGFTSRWSQATPCSPKLVALNEENSARDLLTISGSRPVSSDGLASDALRKSIQQAEKKKNTTSRRKDQAVTVMGDSKSTAEGEKEESRAMACARLALDICPACVILLNALHIGMSNDLHPDHDIWTILENVWISCYTVEFVAKCALFGVRNYFVGPDKLWNWFDGLCLSISFVELIMTYLLTVASPSPGVMGFMKMLRLARLARLIRALKYRIFYELKQMVMGVFAGLKVLAWAIVLLIFCIFFLGVSMRTLIGDDEAEFRTVPHAMMTMFRCYTDGCSAYNGTPLPERLFEEYGFAFMMFYILSFMFVTVGIFNLIMAIFLENVVSSSDSRRLEELGKESEKCQMHVTQVIAQLLADDPKNAELHDFINNKGKIDKGISVEALLEQFDSYVVTRGTFHRWLDDDTMNHMLTEAGIETASKWELFDVLDVDMGGELTVVELVAGLMRLRGCITKADMIAVRLQVRYLTTMVEEVRELNGGRRANSQRLSTRLPGPG